MNGVEFVDLEPGDVKQETSILTYASRSNAQGFGFRANSRWSSLDAGMVAQVAATVNGGVI